MNTPNDLRWIMLATVPIHSYANVNVVTPVARGIVWLCRRLADGRRRRMINRYPRTRFRPRDDERPSWAAIGDSSGVVTSRKEIAMILKHEHVRRLQ